VVSLVCFRNLTWGLAAVAALSFLEAIPAVAGQGLSGSKLLTAMVVFAWFAVITTQRQTREFFWKDHPFLSAIIAAFLAWVLFSATWAQIPTLALTVLGSYGLALLLFPVTYTAMKDIVEVKRLLGVLVFFAFIAAMYGFIIDPSASGASGGDPTAELNRLGGSIGDPNRFAAKVLPGVIIAMALALVTKAPLGRLFFWGAAGVGIIAVLLSLSRGGLIAAAAVCVLAPLITQGSRGKVTFVVCCVIGLGVVALYALTPPESRQRITESDGGNGREDIWKVGWRMVQAHPVNGIGAGNFENTSIQYLIQPGAIQRDEYFIAAPKVAHNSYLHVLAELGYVGLTLFMGIIVIGLTCLYKAGRAAMRIGDHDLRILSQALFLAALSVLVANFFISEQLAKLPWLLLALGPAMLAIARDRERELQSAQPALKTSS
jgi:O-antigen ligase